MDNAPLSSTVAPQAMSVPGFRGELINAESSGRNVTNPQEGAEGFYQITGPTWQDFAPRAGIDLKQYPSAISAPYEVQSKVADTIPMGRWGPRTQQILAAKYGQLDPRQPMGTFAQRFGAGPGAPGGPMPAVPPVPAAGGPVPQAPMPEPPAVPQAPMPAPPPVPDAQASLPGAPTSLADAFTQAAKRRQVAAVA